MKTITTIFIIAVFASATALANANSCATGQVKEGVSCNALSDSFLGQSSLSEISTSAVVFTTDQIYQAFQDPGQSCPNDCLKDTYSSLRKGQFRGTKDSYDERVKRIRADMVLKLQMSETRTALRNFARKLQSIDAYRRISRGDPNIASCDTKSLQQVAARCQSKPFYKQAMGEIARIYGLPEKTPVDALARIFQEGILKKFNEANHACTGAPETKVLYNQYIEALGSQPIDESILQMISSGQLSQRIDQACGDKPAIDCSVKEFARLKVLLDMSPERRAKYSAMDAADMAYNTELQSKWKEASSWPRHPIFSMMLAYPKSLSALASVVKSASQSDKYNLGVFLVRNSESTEPLATAFEARMCQELSENLNSILCADDTYFDNVSEDDLTIPITFALELKQDKDPVNVLPLNQLAIMGVMCARTPKVEKTTVDNLILSSGIDDISKFSAIEKRPMTYINDEQSAATSTFTGYSRVLCEAMDNKPSDDRAGVYTSGFFQREARMMKDVVARPIIVIDSETPINLQRASVTDLMLTPVSIPVAVEDKKTPPPFSSGAAMLEEVADVPVSTMMANAPLVPAPMAAVLPSMATVPVSPVPVIDSSAPSPVAASVVSQPIPARVESGESETVQAYKTRIDQLEKKMLENQMRDLERRREELEASRNEAEEKLNAATSSETSAVLPSASVTVERSPTSLAKGSVAPARGGNAGAVSSVARVSESALPVIPVSNGVAAPIMSNDILTGGGIGLEGSPSSRAVSLNRNLSSQPRAVLVSKSADGNYRLVTKDGKEVASDSVLSDQDILLLLNDINSNPQFVGVIQDQAGALEITVGGRRIVVDAAKITDPTQRQQINLLVSEIRLRQVQKVRSAYFARMKKLLVRPEAI